MFLVAEPDKISDSSPEAFRVAISRFTVRQIREVMPVPVTARAVRFWKSGQRLPNAAMRAFLMRELQRIGK